MLKTGKHKTTKTTPQILIPEILDNDENPKRGIHDSNLNGM